MRTPRRSPTLLVFTLGAQCESRRRQLLPARWGAVEERLHRACLGAALDAGRAAGCRLEVAAPRRLDLPGDVRQRTQTGRGFGARLRASVRAAFAAGAGPVVLVGSDVPALSASHVERTLELLAGDPRRVVVGPSPDGGFYLLASAEPLDDALAEVRWCCRLTLRSLRRALARRGRAVVVLEPLADLDRPSDLERWLASAGASRSALVTLLRRLLAALRRARWAAYTAPPPCRSATRLPPLRAPPVAA